MPAKVKDMTLTDVENFVEQKVMEILGDPDSGLKLRKEFKEKLLQRRDRKNVKRYSHKEVKERFG